MSKSIEENKRFLSNIFHKGPFEGHAYVCHPPADPVYDPKLRDYTMSDRPVTDFVGYRVAAYETEVQFHATLADHTVPAGSPSTPTYIYAAAFGCPVQMYDDSPGAALPAVRTAAEADALELPDLWSSPTLVRVFEMCHELEKRLGKDVPLGPPDLQSGFDTASLVWEKSAFLMAMMLEPDAVKRLAAKCAGFYKTFLIELRKEFPQMSPAHCPRAWAPPDLGPWLSNDEAGAFNTPMFEEFCLPELVDLADTFGGIGMHCCADAEHQFESFKRIPNFYAFNRVPGKRGWDPLLEHFDGPDAPVHVLGWQSVANVAYFLERAHEGTRFVFVHHSQSLEKAREWLDAVQQLPSRVPVPA